MRLDGELDARDGWIWPVQSRTGYGVEMSASCVIDLGTDDETSGYISKKPNSSIFHPAWPIYDQLRIWYLQFCTLSSRVIVIRSYHPFLSDKSRILPLSVPLSVVRETPRVTHGPVSSSLDYSVGPKLSVGTLHFPKWLVAKLQARALYLEI